MNDQEKRPTGLLHSTQELRQLIIDNPDLPILAFVGENATCGDYYYTSCSYVSAQLGEYLDCRQTVNDERCYTDRDDFEEQLRDNHYDFDGSDAEFDAFIEKQLLEYDPYWKPCIILYVDN